MSVKLQQVLLNNLTTSLLQFLDVPCRANETPTEPVNAPGLFHKPYTKGTTEVGTVDADFDGRQLVCRVYKALDDGDLRLSMMSSSILLSCAIFVFTAPG